MTPAQLFERQVMRAATIAKARAQWRQRQLRQPVGSWTMVYRSWR